MALGKLDGIFTRVINIPETALKMRMYFSIDRILGPAAVLIGEDGKPLDLPVSFLPEGSKPGDMLFYEEGKFTPAPEKAKERRERVAGMLGILLKHEDE